MGLNQPMPRRRYEKPQKGNPHSLPIRQHVFPSASIGRFTNDQGVVDLCRLASSQVRKAAPDDDILCARRAWDARAEFGYMKQIEDAFQPLASKIVDSTLTAISAAEKETVDYFYGLWKMRALYRDKETTDVAFKKVTGTNFSKDQQELLEKSGTFFLKEGEVMSAHRWYGIEVQVSIDREVMLLSNLRWGVVRAHEGQFLVPDMPTVACIPIAPTLALCGTEGDVIENATMPKNGVIGLNRVLKQHCKDYLFANDLGQCF
jgi:hypothetical protein